MAQEMDKKRRIRMQFNSDNEVTKHVVSLSNIDPTASADAVDSTCNILTSLMDPTGRTRDNIESIKYSDIVSDPQP